MTTLPAPANPQDAVVEIVGELTPASVASRGGRRRCRAARARRHAEGVERQLRRTERPRRAVVEPGGRESSQAGAR